MADIRHARTIQPPTDAQIEYLNHLKRRCELYGIPCERTIQSGMRDKRSARYAIKNLNKRLEQKGYFEK